RADPVVQSSCDGAEPTVQRLAGRRELDGELPAVLQIAGAGDEAFALEAVEVPGHGGSLDPQFLREPRLARPSAAFDAVQHDPGRERGALVCERVLEELLDGLGGHDDLPRQRFAFHTLTYLMIRCLTNVTRCPVFVNRGRRSLVGRSGR